MVRVDLAASPLGMAPESFPGNVGYLCSARKGLSYWKERDVELASVSDSGCRDNTLYSMSQLHSS